MVIEVDGGDGCSVVMWRCVAWWCYMKVMCKILMCCSHGVDGMILMLIGGVVSVDSVVAMVLMLIGGVVSVDVLWRWCW